MFEKLTQAQELVNAHFEEVVGYIAFRLAGGTSEDFLSDDKRPKLDCSREVKILVDLINAHNHLLLTKKRKKFVAARKLVEEYGILSQTVEPLLRLNECRQKAIVNIVDMQMNHYVETLFSEN